MKAFWVRGQTATLAKIPVLSVVVLDPNDLTKEASAMDEDDAGGDDDDDDDDEAPGPETLLQDR